MLKDRLTSSAQISNMTATTATQIAALQATANTRRCHNSFFRQEQLKALHDVLRTRSSDVVTAIRKDTDVTSAEATTQCALALSIIKEHYEAINPGKELEDQHRITEGKNARDRREPWGVVYIEPDLKHTPFFSIVIVIGAAMAAGNCIALKVNPYLTLLRDMGLTGYFYS
jgi:aldehyde dehydrogenase (NAD+)